MITLDDFNNSFDKFASNVYTCTNASPPKKKQTSPFAPKRELLDHKETLRKILIDKNLHIGTITIEKFGTDLYWVRGLTNKSFNSMESYQMTNEDYIKIIPLLNTIKTIYDDKLRFKKLSKEKQTAILLML